MFTLEEVFLFEIFYIVQTDFYLRIILYFTGIFTFLELLRLQVSEVDVLQLVPGFYFFLFFISFLYFYFFSEALFRIPIEIDNLKVYGTKVTSKFEINILLKLSFFFLSILLLLIFNTVIPLSLDSFNSSGEKTLNNLWAFSEILCLELFVLVILIIISQIPLFFIINFNTQILVNGVTRFWKFLIFGITLIAGFLTPTLDGYTQISFATSTFLFYLFIINFLQKRILLKLNIFLPFGC